MTKRKIEEKLEKVFQEMACDDPYAAVHVTAAAAAGIVAICPVGADAYCLRAAEILMLISIYGHYNIKVSKAVARTIMTSSFAEAVGSSVALTALEAANAVVLLHPFVGYAIKCSVAVSLIEAIGIASIKSLEGGGSPAAEELVRAMCAVGFAGDLKRVSGGICKITGNLSASLQIPEDDYVKKLDEQILECKRHIKMCTDSYEDSFWRDDGNGGWDLMMQKHYEERLATLTAERQKFG